MDRREIVAAPAAMVGMDALRPSPSPMAIRSAWAASPRTPSRPTLTPNWPFNARTDFTFRDHHLVLPNLLASISDVPAKSWPS